MLFESNTLFQVALSAALIGCICGMSGSILTLKNAVSAAYAVSFASLPGLVLPFLLISTVKHWALLSGVAFFGTAAALQLLFFINKKNRDAFTALIMTLSFGFGMLLLSAAEHYPGAAQIDLHRFLIGDAAVNITADIRLLGYTAISVFALFILFWKEIIAVAFDPEFARSSGIPAKFFEALAAILLAVSVLTGLEAIGVIFIGTLITVPSIAARQWTNDTGAVFILAIGFAAIAGCAGSVAAALLPGLPTGAAVTLFVCSFALISFLIAPSHGILWREFRKKHILREPDNTKLLKLLRSLSAQQEPLQGKGHSISLINALFGGDDEVDSILLELKVKGLAADNEQGFWYITRDGEEYIDTVRHKPSKKVR
ncbi:MAG: metal ABC transporter permease [Deferribacteraceae bacterium]|jgi:manganese/zinc/iron transport system permease protein|nr:metal ABC transporter permease [Deferribacteraceae bacterium]